MTKDIKLDIDSLSGEVIPTGAKQLSDIDDAMIRLCNAVAVLTMSGWSGEAKDAFLVKFTAFKQDMRTFYNNLDSFQNTLQVVRNNGHEVSTAARGLTSSI